MRLGWNLKLSSIDRRSVLVLSLIGAAMGLPPARDIVSEDGQRAFGRGGLTPARPGIKAGDGIRHTYSSIAEAVGEQNIFYIGYDPDALRDYDAFVARWKQTFNVS